MHMGDALISPAVGGAMWATTIGLTAYAAKRLRAENSEKTPLMATLGAFVFSAQMINFSIPWTGSSGHLGGGLLLAILLGPYAAFLTIFAVLAIQALFFADGGLLAMGCNVFNLGFWPAFAVYPFISRYLTCAGLPGAGRLMAVCIPAAVIGLQLGALGVVLQTLASGRTDLPFTTFALYMQPIHLAIGIVEGIITAAVVAAVVKARPELLAASSAQQMARSGQRPLAIALIAAALMIGGVLSWFASQHDDGLEWSIAKTIGQSELDPPRSAVHASLAALQEKISLLPDYDFKKPQQADAAEGEEEGGEGKDGEKWPAVNAGTSVAGIVGSVLVLLLAGFIGLALRRPPSGKF